VQGRKATALLGLLLGAACSSTDNGSIQLVTGEETDTFTRAPAATKLQVESVDTTGTRTVLASVALPATTIDLGTQSESTVATLEVTGFAANGERVVFGSSLPYIFAGLAGATVPIFVQRVNDFARLPAPLSDTRQAPLLSQVQGQYLFVAGGAPSTLSATSQIYDFAALAPFASPPTLPFAPLSMAFVGTVGWLFAADGTAAYFDLASDTSQGIPAVAGGSFADVAGGQTIVGDNGVQYIVGATRITGNPTAAILAIDPNDTSNSTYLFGGPKWITLRSARLGAAAAWVPGRGLVVVGGSSTAAGAEFVSSGTTTSTALAYPPDATVLAGATALSNDGTVLVAGGYGPNGDAGVRTITLSCPSACAPTVWQPAFPVPVPLVAAQAFTMSATSAFVVGSEFLTGTTHAFVATMSGLTEVATKVPHTNARATWSPLGSIVLLGGSRLIESFSF
jgi:hypothetical protein